MLSWCGMGGRSTKRRRREEFKTLSELVDSFPPRADNPAILSFDRQGIEVYPYERLAREIRLVAGGLQSRGIAAGDKIMLLAPNAPEWVVAFFGVVCTGATAIPLDDQSSDGTVAAICQRARPRLILTTQAHLRGLRDLEIAERKEYFLLDAPGSHPKSWRRLTENPPVAPPAIGADQIASLLYTSGTTGTPKGVPLTHGNLIANVNALSRADLMAAGDRLLMPLPMHHTYPFTVGLLSVLGIGATLLLPAGISGPEIARAAREGGATALLAVPRLCEAVWDSVQGGVRGRGTWSERFFNAALATSIAIRRSTRVRIGRVLFRAIHRRLGGRLRMIGCGGAKLNAELAWNLEGLGFRVLTGYGLTETAPVLTFNRPHGARLGSEGRPIAGVELKIEREPGRDHGEILARGPNVFSGYWDDPVETRAAFTEDGWFRTGDLGWLDADGYLYVEGRSKEVIVLPDGKNVIPEQLEETYGESPLLQEIAVLEHEGALVALLVPNEQAIREHGALREAGLLRESLDTIAMSLPPYQRITAPRTTRKALPRTRLGKLKRHLLPALYREGAADDALPESAPLSAEDRALLEKKPVSLVWLWLQRRFPDRHLTLDTSPQLDLQVDSLEWVSITTELEGAYGIHLTGEAVSRVLTLRDLLQEVEASGVIPGSRDVDRQAAYRPPGRVAQALGGVVLGLVRVLVRTLYRLRVTGVERICVDAPLVIAPNHASYLDPLAVASALPRRRLSDTYWAGWVGIMFTGPASRFLSRALRVFPVDPDRDLLAAVETARELVREGHSVVWFPEGNRSPTGGLQPFQPGVGVLLRGSDALIVPTAIFGSYGVWPRHQRFPRRGSLRVAFGRPLSVAALLERGSGDSDVERIRSALEREVAALLEGGGQ